MSIMRKEYRVYVRGHGGDAKTGEFGVSSPVSVITIGEFGCTMSDEVADRYFFNHATIDTIKRDIDADNIIYWTYAQRENYYKTGRLDFSRPTFNMTTAYPEVGGLKNLILQGHNGISGFCGVAYYDELSREMTPIIKLGHKEEISLQDIIKTIQTKTGIENVQIFWTACMSADYYQGSRKKVSLHP